jgi:hypothetical protein
MDFLGIAPGSPRMMGTYRKIVPTDVPVGLVSCVQKLRC